MYVFLLVTTCIVTISLIIWFSCIQVSDSFFQSLIVLDADVCEKVRAFFFYPWAYIKTHGVNFFGYCEMSEVRFAGTHGLTKPFKSEGAGSISSKNISHDCTLYFACAYTYSKPASHVNLSLSNFIKFDISISLLNFLCMCLTFCGLVR